MVLIFTSAGSSECPLSDEVWKHAQFKETAKWQAERLGHSLFWHQFQIALLTVLHSEVQLGSAGMPPHFGLSLCSPLEYIRLPYISWKGTFLAFIWGIVACPIPSGCIDMAWLCECVNRPSYLSLNYLISHLIHEEFVELHVIRWTSCYSLNFMLTLSTAMPLGDVSYFDC